MATRNVNRFWTAKEANALGVIVWRVVKDQPKDGEDVAAICSVLLRLRIECGDERAFQQAFRDHRHFNKWHKKFMRLPDALWKIVEDDSIPAASYLRRFFKTFNLSPDKALAHVE